MTESDTQQPKSKYLSITNRTIRFGARVYQLRNVTNIAMLVIKPTYKVTVKGFILSGILFFVLMSIENNISRLFGLFSLLIFCGGIYERITKKPEYALQLETSSGSQKLISSTDKDFIEEIVAKIYIFMNDDSLDAKYIFNLEDKSISVEGDVKDSIFSSGDAYDSFTSKPPISKPSKPKSSRLKGTGLQKKNND